ncbi:MAG: hypothetical protein ABI885_24200 [Gammaproteobacteria bacterium]
MANPTLFTRHPACGARSVIAQLNDGVVVTPGSSVTVHLRDEKLMVVREMTCIGIVERPPADLVHAIRNMGNQALGSCRQFNEFSGTADVEVK